MPERRRRRAETKTWAESAVRVRKSAVAFSPGAVEGSALSSSAVDMLLWTGSRDEILLRFEGEEEGVEDVRARLGL